MDGRNSAGIRRNPPNGFFLFYQIIFLQKKNKKKINLIDSGHATIEANEGHKYFTKKKK